MTTLREVAEAAGVSMSVASRALTADPNTRMSPQTRARVIEIAARLDYTPNERSRALRFARSGAIALVVPDVTNAVFADLVAGIRGVATEAGVAVLLGQLSSGVSDPRALAEIIGEGRVDGVVLQRAEGIDDQQLSQLVRIRPPLVLFNTTLPDHKGSVALDDSGAARTAVRHLIELGHSRIGFIGGSSTHDAARRRLAGYRAELAGARLPDLSVEAGWEAEGGGRAMLDLLARPERCTAVVAASINAAVGAAGAAMRAGVVIPRDLSVVSIQDNWIAKAFHPALTVVRMPLQEAGAAAARMLLSVIAGGSPADLVLTDPAPDLVVRSSSAPPA